MAVIDIRYVGSEVICSWVIMLAGGGWGRTELMEFAERLDMGE